MIRHFQVNVETLTPLHIGTGQTLLKDFDYAVHNRRTYRLNLLRLAETLYDRDPKLLDLLQARPPAELLNKVELSEDSEFVRYVLAGEPEGRELREQIKDPQDRVYLPGSSLKGALRTVLAWHGWRSLGLPGLDRLVAREHPAKFAAQHVEQRIFGRDPNHDLLRALRIADSSPLANRGEGLRLEVVKVWTERGAGVPITVEAVSEGVRFSLEASVDGPLFSDWAKRREGFHLPHPNWLQELGKIASQRALERINEERRVWQHVLKSAAINPYDRVDRATRAKMDAQQLGFPLQLGFGTGWCGMTIGTPLKEDPGFRTVYQRFRLGRGPGKRGVVKPEDFPSSRRVVVRGADVLPLGWVWVEWKELTS